MGGRRDLLAATDVTPKTVYGFGFLGRTNDLFGERRASDLHLGLAIWFWRF